MPDIYIRSYKNCAKADLSFQGLCVIGAKNMGGKSSLAEAIRAALTGEGLALDGSGERLTKKDSAPRLVRHGAEKGSSMVRLEDSASTMTWPKCEYATEGASPPHASRMAAGLDSLARLKPDERARFLTDLLKATPTEEELLAAIEAAKIGRAAEVAEFVWDEAGKHGWDHVLKLAKDKGATRKGQWREASGENWGADKAAAWAPQGWSPKWDALMPEDATAGLAAIEAELAAFDKTHGKVLANADDLKAKAESLPALEAKALPDLKKLGEALVKAEDQRNALPRSADEPEAVHPCPQCQAMLAVAPGQTPPWRLPNPNKPSAAELAKLRKAIDAANQAVNAAKNALAQAHVELREHDRALTEARSAAERLKGAAEPTGADERAALVQRLERAREVGDMIRRRARAAEIHAQIVDNGKLVDLLAPDGLRQAKVKDALVEFNDRLGELCEWMGVPGLWVGDDMAIVGTPPDDDGIESLPLPYWLMSASEQFRTRIILQAAIAAYDGSSMLIIDNDVDQDRAWLKGTLRMLARLGLPAVLTVRADTPEEVPPAPPPGRGVDMVPYWINADGVVVPIGEALAREAAE